MLDFIFIFVWLYFDIGLLTALLGILLSILKQSYTEENNTLLEVFRIRPITTCMIVIIGWPDIHITVLHIIILRFKKKSI